MPKNNDKGKPGGNPTPPDGAIVGTDGVDQIDLTTTPGATTGDDIIWGLGGGDLIDGDAGNDMIEGGDGFDTLFGGEGDDTINGGAGDDTIVGGPGSDTIDGGDGFDVAIFEGTEDDYTITEDVTVTGKGKKQTTTTTYTVIDNATGDTDTLSNIELLLFADPPAGGQLITQGELYFAPFDSPTVMDVLANDDVGEGSAPGDFLTVTGVLDPVIDLNGDGINDVDLIPDDAVFADYAAPGGVQLTNGTYLSFDTNTQLFTWEDRDAVLIQPAPGEDPITLNFWYAVEDTEGFSDFGDVSLIVTYPAPSGTLDFDDMVLDDFFLLFGIYRYLDGPDASYGVQQLSTAGGGISEARDTSAAGNFDYDGDGDDEWRVWTDQNGTTHEMNVVHTQTQPFDLVSLTIGDLDADEAATLVLMDASGTIIQEIGIADTDLTGGVYDVSGNANASGIGQFSVVADAGDSFWIEDVFLL